MKFTLVINVEIETTKGDQENFPNCGIQVTAKSLSTGDAIEGILLEESEELPGQDLSPVGTSRSLEGKGKGKSKSTKTAVSSRTPRAKSKGKGKSTKKSSANRTLLTKDKGRGKTKILDKKKDVNKPGKKITKKVIANEILSSKSKGKGKLSKMTKGVSASRAPSGVGKGRSTKTRKIKS